MQHKENTPINYEGRKLPLGLAAGKRQAPTGYVRPVG